MKTIRAFGAAVVLALLVGALFGAGSASAVALCKESGTGFCPPEQTYPAGTILSGSLEGVVKFSTSGGGEALSGECKKSSWEGKTTAAGGEKTVPGILFSFTIGECTSNMEACVDEWLNLVWSTTIDNMGNYAWTNGGNGAPALRTKCFFGLFHCRYGANAILGTIVPGNPAVVQVNQTLALQADPPGGNSFGCGANYTLVAKWNVAPAPLFIR